MLVVCGSCDKCYSESLPACNKCGATLQQQIDDNYAELRIMKAELKGYERGINDGVRIGLGQRIYNFFFFW